MTLDEMTLGFFFAPPPQSAAVHGRPHIGANWISWPPGKMDEKLRKRKHVKKRAVFCIF